MKSRTELQRILSVLVLALTMIAALPVLAQDELDQITYRIDDLRTQHALMMESFGHDHSAFSGLNALIDRLKEERDNATVFQSGAELQQAQRVAREAAIALHAQQELLRGLTGQIEALAADLSNTVSSRIAEIERSLSGADADTRMSLISELNRLNPLRDAYQVELPEVPQVDFGAILVGLDDDVTPEELRATAEELEDNERALQDSLGVIEARIQQIQQQVDLQERHDVVLSEAGLFEEQQNSGQGTRPVAARASITGGRGGEDAEARSAGGTEEAGTGPTENEGTPSLGVQGETESGGVASDGGGSDPDQDGQNGFTGTGTDSSDEDFGAQESDDASEPPEIPEEPSTSGGSDGVPEPPDAFTAPEPTIGTSPPPSAGIERGTDPVLLLETGSDDAGDSGRNLNSRLGELQQEQESIERQLNELRRHRRDILERADELDAEEGF
jgi:chaperonin cofactor prefoldin